ncbi:MAG: MFS transporter [Spirochaetales bacterium]|nr:MFS transporter [Spirochaetales bacterium]
MKINKIDSASAITFMVYAATAVLTPICLLKMSDELSFTLSGGGAIEAGRTFLLLITLFISGKAASKLGKGRTIALGLIVTSASLIFAGFSQTYWGVMSLIFIIGFGTGFAEALINPLVHDNHPKDSSKYLNIINAFFSLGVVAAVLISGLLLTIGVSWRILFIGLGIITLIPALMLLTTYKKDLKESGQETSLHHWVNCLRRPAFWLLAAAIFFGAACEAAFIFWSASYIQLHFKALPSAAGIGTALFAGAMFTGRLITAKITRGHHYDRLLMLVASLCGIGVSFAAYTADSLYLFYFLLFAAGIVVAPYWPTIQAISTKYVDGDPTLLFILLSCAGIPGIGGASLLMGVIGDNYGLQSSFLLIPVFFILLSIVLFILRWFSSQAGNS